MTLTSGKKAAFTNHLPSLSSSQSGVVHEGQQAKREESEVCGTPSPPESAGHGLNTKWLEIGGGAGGERWWLAAFMQRKEPK